MNKKPRNHWTFDNCKMESLKYKTKTKFQKNSNGAYTSSLKNGWLDEICSHMIEIRKPKGYWTYERCKKESQRYKEKTDFIKNNKSCYLTSYKNDWIVDFFQ